jgi:hypothetical protein
MIGYNSIPGYVTEKMLRNQQDGLKANQPETIHGNHIPERKEKLQWKVAQTGT